MRLAIMIAACAAQLAALTCTPAAIAQVTASPAPARCPTGPNLQEGTVKFFNEQRGYGFIIPAKGGVDIFVHHSALGDVTLKADDRVVFEVTSGDKGPVAANIRVCS